MLITPKYVQVNVELRLKKCYDVLSVYEYCVTHVSGVI